MDHSHDHDHPHDHGGGHAHDHAHGDAGEYFLNQLLTVFICGAGTTLEMGAAAVNFVEREK